MLTGIYALLEVELRAPFFDFVAFDPLKMIDSTVTSDTTLDANGDLNSLVLDLSFNTADGLTKYQGRAILDADLNEATGSIDTMHFNWDVESASVSDPTTGTPSLSFESQGDVQLAGNGSITDPLHLTWGVDNSSVGENSAGATETLHSTFSGDITEVPDATGTGVLDRDWSILGSFLSKLDWGGNTMSVLSKVSTTGDIEITATGDGTMVTGEAHVQNLQDVFLNHVRKTKVVVDEKFHFNGKTVDVSVTQSDGSGTSLVPGTTMDFTLPINPSPAGVTNNPQAAWDFDHLFAQHPASPDVGVDLLHSGLLSPESVAADTSVLTALVDNIETLAEWTAGGDALSVLFEETYAYIPQHNASDFSFLTSLA